MFAPGSITGEALKTPRQGEPLGLPDCRVLDKALPSRCTAFKRLTNAKPTLGLVITCLAVAEAS